MNIQYDFDAAYNARIDLYFVITLPPSVSHIKTGGKMPDVCRHSGNATANRKDEYPFPTRKHFIALTYKWHVPVPVSSQHLLSCDREPNAMPTVFTQICVHYLLPNLGFMLSRI